MYEEVLTPSSRLSRSFAYEANLKLGTVGLRQIKATGIEHGSTRKRTDLHGYEQYYFFVRSVLIRAFSVKIRVPFSLQLHSELGILHPALQDGVADDVDAAGNAEFAHSVCLMGLDRFYA